MTRRVYRITTQRSWVLSSVESMRTSSSWFKDVNQQASWNILQKSHEGNTNVKKTRLDQLASRFENLKMDPNEIILQFSSKLSSIAGETKVLGKT